MNAHSKPIGDLQKRGNGRSHLVVFDLRQQRLGKPREIGQGLERKPLLLPQTADHEDTESLDSRPAPIAVQGCETVLLVEDDPGVATLVATALEKSGYTVLQAMDADRALSIVRSHEGPIDAILRQGVKTGTVHFIQKPFSMDALTVKLREALKTGSSSASGR